MATETVYVSLRGDDRWSGRLATPNDEGTDGPLASLSAARDAVRARLMVQPEGRYIVELSGGTYHLEQPLVLGPEDSGRPGCPVVWRSAEGERVILSAGVPLGDWQRARADLPGQTEGSRGKLWMAKVPPGTRFFTLYDGEGLLPRARSERLLTAEREGADRQTLFMRPDDVPSLANVSDAELFIIPQHPWVTNYLPIASIDPERGVLRTRVPGTYLLQSHGGWKIIRSFYCIENGLEYLTEPGEWVLDSQTGRVYLWPRQGDEPESVCYAGSDEIVLLQGELDAGAWVHDIRLEGLIFRHAERMHWEPESPRLGVQHDWDVEDGGWAAVRVRGGRDVTVSHCVFEHSGGGGIKLDLRASGCRVVCNVIRELGGSGVSMVGYGPGARDENHDNEVGQNHIHHCGRLWWHSSAIFCCQSGSNRIHNNLIHDMSYSGITLVSGRAELFQPRPGNGFIGDGMSHVKWNEIPEQADPFYHAIGYAFCKYNVVEHNEIHHVMELLGDGNGIYVSGTGPGNVVRRNYVHDIAGAGCQSGIRLDDRQWYTHVTENVVWRVSGGGITLKDVNDVQNNVIVDAERWGSILVRRTPAYGSQVRRNILVQSGEPMSQEGAQPPFYDGGGFGGNLSEPVIDDNLLWCTEDQGAAERCLSAMRALGQEQRSRIAEPGFVDLAAGDFRLRAGSPARDLGIRSIESWGLVAPVGLAARLDDQTRE